MCSKNAWKCLLLYVGAYLFAFSFAEAQERDEHPEIKQEAVEAAGELRVLWDRQTRNLGVNIEMREGNVVLSGTVRSKEEKADAEEVLARMTPRSGIINEIVVDPSTPAPPARQGAFPELLGDVIVAMIVLLVLVVGLLIYLRTRKSRRDRELREELSSP